MYVLTRQAYLSAPVALGTIVQVGCHRERNALLDIIVQLPRFKFHAILVIYAFSGHISKRHVPLENFVQRLPRQVHAQVLEITVAVARCRRRSHALLEIFALP